MENNGPMQDFPELLLAIVFRLMVIDGFILHTAEYANNVFINEWQPGKILPTLCEARSIFSIENCLYIPIKQVFVGGTHATLFE